MKTYTEEITLHEGTVEVTFTYYAGRPGTREEPPEPEEIEIDKVMYVGVDVTPILGHEDFKDIEEALGRLGEDRRNSAEELKADRLYEEEKDRRNGL
jgi:hypothetical protein